MCKDDVFGEWEYENPPMELGVEYRTTERYMEKPVYTMAVSIGVSVSGSKNTDVPVGENCYPIRCSGYVGSAYCIPYSEDNVSTNRIWLNASPTTTGIRLTLWCGSTFAGLQGYAQVWYTKHAD